MAKKQIGISMLLAVAAVALLSCSEATTSSGTSNPPGPAEGRKDTKSVKALDAVGYNGDQIRKNLDSSLNKQDQRNKDLEQAGQGVEGQ